MTSYTAKQWAEIEGGHTMSDQSDSESFSFLQELSESRMTRDSRNQVLLTYTDCREKAYLTVLCLHAMRYYRKYSVDAGKYAYKTVMFRDYRRFRIDSTDLYNLFYFITGDQQAHKKLKDPAAAAKERKRTSISVGSLNGFLRRISTNDKVTQADQKILFTLESELNIKNIHYKAIRRRLSSFDTDTQEERKTTITRLLFAARSKLTDSDIMPLFAKFTNDNNLEDFSATSPEPKVSTPDMSGLGKVQNYRFLVPLTSLPFVSRYLKMLQAGQSIPSSVAGSYFPIVIMIHDIVTAGPAYIQQLKILHKRAKRDLKR